MWPFFHEGLISVISPRSSSSSLLTELQGRSTSEHCSTAASIGGVCVHCIKARCPMASLLIHWRTIDINSMASGDKLKCQQWQRWASPVPSASSGWGDGPSAERLVIKRWHQTRILTHTHTHTLTRTLVTRHTARRKTLREQEEESLWWNGLNIHF